LSIAITAAGLVWGYAFAPTDREQGDAAGFCSEIRLPGML
jgi:hypothetical protein